MMPPLTAAMVRHPAQAQLRRPGRGTGHLRAPGPPRQHDLLLLPGDAAALGRRPRQRLWPLALRADQCHVNAWFLVPQRLLGLRSEQYWRKNYDIFCNAIDEDFTLAASMQSGLSSGANSALRFGASEFACDAFHRSMEARLGRPDNLQREGAATRKRPTGADA